MTRYALSLGFGFLALLSLDVAAAPAASTAAPPETVAPSESTAVGNATTIPLAPSAATSVPEATTQAAAAPTTATQASVAPATSSQAPANAAAPAASSAVTATPAAAAPPPVPAPTAVPTQASPATLCSSGRTSLPSRGMNMDNVEHIFGTPVEKYEAVGKPPITRWDYADYAVYFEYNLVLHTVMKSAPFSDSQAPTC